MKHYNLCFCSVLLASAALRSNAEIGWTVHSIGRVPGKPPVVLTEVAYGNGIYLAIGRQGEIYRAFAPNEWNALSSIDSAVLEGIAYGSGLFIVSGIDEALKEAVILTSTNGLSWNRQPLGTEKWLHEIAYGNGEFVAVGHDIIARSVNGVEWTVDTQFVQAPSVRFSALAFGNGHFIAAQTLPLPSPGHLPTFAFLRSATGLTWESSEVHFPNVIAIIYGRNKYLAISLGYDCSPCSGPNFLSADGLEWSRFIPGSSQNPRSAAYGNGVFVVATVRELLSSKDALGWETFAVEDGLVMDVAFGANRFVAVGQGVIIVSDEIEFQPLLSNVGIQAAKIHFEADAPEGTTWAVEASEDLSEWSLVGEVKGTASAFESVSVPIHEGKRFLRLVDRGGNP